MAEDVPAAGRTTAGAFEESWNDAYDRYRRLDPAGLSPSDLDALADAAWWTGRISESVAARQKAYRGHVRAGDTRRAAAAAWLLYYEFVILGDEAVAGGWLGRVRRHLEPEPDCVEHGYLAFAEAEIALWSGRPEDALTPAERLAALGERFRHPDLMALGMDVKGRTLIALGKTAEGVRLLDEAMCSVVAGELSPLVTGWIYCNVISACWALADMRRAGEWTDAAMRWCEDLPTDAAPYTGLCRIHRVEIATLRGRWPEAERDARRTCDELLAYTPRIAGPAFYATGEIRLLKGDLAGAETLFGRAHELGADPQPGLALVALARGRAAAAATALRVALSGSNSGPLARSRLLAAHVEAALRAGDLDSARAAATELETIAAASESTVLRATAACAGGAVALAEGDAEAALASLRRAVAAWQDIDAPYELARTRLLLGEAFRAAGDEEGARLEFGVARRTFERLGAAPAARQAAVLEDRESRLPQGLTPREAEVLRLVATGMTNRDIAAELVVSQHTVARHVNHIFAKLGVSSRAAATALAFEHDLA